MAGKAERDYLLQEQYKKADNLNARAQLHQRFSTNPYGWHRWAFDQLRLPQEARILELGCGPGMLWRENLDRVPPGWKITLSDFSPGMVDEAQGHLAGSGPAFCFEVIDAQAIPFGDGEFEAVIANHMLYHVPDIPLALSETRRVLRSDGRLYASTVGRGHMGELRDLLDRFAPGLSPWNGIAAKSFLLENGQPQIEEWFAAVSLTRYEDGLVVTDPEALVAYALSTKVASSLVGDRRERFERFVHETLAQGPFRVTKDTGIFEAVSH